MAKISRKNIKWIHVDAPCSTGNFRPKLTSLEACAENKLVISDFFSRYIICHFLMLGSPSACLGEG
jgi:hypothetical protein